MRIKWRWENQIGVQTLLAARTRANANDFFRINRLFEATSTFPRGVSIYRQAICSSLLYKRGNSPSPQSSLHEKNGSSRAETINCRRLAAMITTSDNINVRPPLLDGENNTRRRCAAVTLDCILKCEDGEGSAGFGSLGLTSVV